MGGFAIKCITVVKSFVNRSILNKLIVSYILVIFIPIVLISILSYAKLVANVKENYYKDNLQTLKTMDKGLQAFLDDFIRLTYNSSLSQDGLQLILRSNNDDEKVMFDNQLYFTSFASSLVGLRDDVEGIYMYTLDGHFFSESRNAGYKSPLQPDYDITAEPWFKKVMGNTEEVLVLGSHEQGFKANPSNKYVVTIARKLRNYQTGALAGVLFVDLKTDMFKKMFEGVDKQAISVVILDEDGSLIYDENEANITRKFSQAYPDIRLEMPDNGVVWVGKEKDYLITLDNVALKWKYIEYVKLDGLVKQTWNAVLPVILISMLCFAVFGLVSIYISRKIAQPIKILKETMSKVEKGDFNQKADIKNEGEIGSLAFSFNTMVEKIQELIHTVYETKLKKIDSEFRALQSQINPHFLYNTLESINCLAQLSENREISEMIQGLARMFRYSIKNDREFVTLEDEINHVKDYIYLQAVRYDNKFDIFYNIPDRLLKVKTIKLILQPIVENAILHGIEGVRGKGRITIDAFIEEERLVIAVSNTGAPITQARLEELNRQLERDLDDLSEFDSKNKSIGIINIHSRLRLHYGQGYGLQISSGGTGAVVRLILPVEEEVKRNV